MHQARNEICYQDTENGSNHYEQKRDIRQIKHEEAGDKQEKNNSRKDGDDLLDSLVGAVHRRQSLSACVFPLNLLLLSHIEFNNFIGVILWHSIMFIDEIDTIQGFLSTH